jgi:two-component system chemotaxis response regulator CheB
LASRDLVVVGASAGGVEALRQLVGGLPVDLPAAVLVVLHIPPRAPSALAAILDRSGPLPATPATDGEPLESGRIVVAPSDHHLLVVDGHVRLSHGPAENGHRPAIDALFRSAARSHGARTVAVVLSGARDDGTAGLASVVKRGGTAIVQDPDDALHPSMPRSALDHVGADHIAPATGIGKLIAGLVGSPVGQAEADHVDELLAAETEVANMRPITTDQMPSRPSGLACPSCHGALFELDGAPAPRYRCRIGHAWSPESLLEEQSETFEGALWIALRALEEKAALGRRMAASARERGSPSSAQRYEAVGDESERASMLIREFIGRTAAADRVTSTAE